MGFRGKRGCARTSPDRDGYGFHCGFARFAKLFFSIIHVLFLTHTLTHEWIASTHYHPSDCVLVLLVVTGGEYESSCCDLEAVVPLGVGVCIRSGRFLIRTSDIPVGRDTPITSALT
jgi:hypothetical protein